MKFEYQSLISSCWTVLYADPKNQVKGSALSPLLFMVVTDAITQGLQELEPWTLLFADDMLASEDEHELELRMQA
ncbi:hypothetical protein Y032_0018g3657 [Ancylostoma ceylanicum]|uniref:Reverse transcriptase domain-containing protein n=1 Tax=Ancylostoma ceylanicum TaxID=53326 RepID=A0A016V4T2_9BILA|nr:hypothetical protein Y032_0018g3657 [Ancylostoma ceylanicum]